MAWMASYPRFGRRCPSWLGVARDLLLAGDGTARLLGTVLARERGLPSVGRSGDCGACVGERAGEWREWRRLGSEEGLFGWGS